MRWFAGMLENEGTCMSLSSTLWKKSLCSLGSGAQWSFKDHKSQRFRMTSRGQILNVEQDVCPGQVVLSSRLKARTE